MQLTSIAPAVPSAQPTDGGAAPVPAYGTVVLTDADGDTTRELEITPLNPGETSPAIAGFRDAIQAANDLVRSRSNWAGSFFNSQPSVAVTLLDDGSYGMFLTGASIHRFDPIDSAKYVHAEVTKTEGSPLVAMVSRSDWADLRTSDVAVGEHLRRVPLLGHVIVD
jgi:hypothetical protein